MTAIQPYQNHSQLASRTDQTLALTQKLLASARPQLIPYRKGKLWGYCTYDKEMIIAPKYRYADTFSEGFARVKIKNDDYFIDEQEQFLHLQGCQLEYNSDFRDGLAVVKKEELWGFLNTEGILAVSCAYSYAKPFDQGRAEVRRNGKSGFIDRNGDEVVPVIYDWVHEFSDGFSIARKDKEWIAVDARGNEVQRFENELFQYFENFAILKVNETYVYLDLKGDQRLNTNYSLYGGFYDGRAAVKKDGKIGFINENCELIVPFQYDQTLLFENGLAVVRLDDKWGAIDPNGNIVMPFIISTKLGPFDYSEGYFSYAENFKYGSLNSCGEVMIPAKYGHWFDFRNGIARIHQNNMIYGFINKDGHEYWED